MAGKGKLTIAQDRCKGCGLCIHFCPKGILKEFSELNRLGYRPVSPEEGGECTGCGICALMCPDMVIQVERGEGA